MIQSETTSVKHGYGSQRLILELVNICNLHCSYCFRSEDDLYNNRAEFFPLELLRKILSDAREISDIKRVVFTGGEPALHPQFAEVLDSVASLGLTTSFVTNGWHFEKIWPAIAANRSSINDVAFSFDGITRESHDKWRGNGSFDRLIKAIARCYSSKLPFAVKVVIRRDNMNDLEQIALFAARMGASSLNFVHVVPTSHEVEEDSSLRLEERQIVEEEIALLSRIFKMQIRLDVGYYNIDPKPPCSPLAGTSLNVDYRGRLTLCCNLSGFRGGDEEADVVADLKSESFSSAYKKFAGLVATQLKRRSDVLAEFASQGVKPDLYAGSPCLFCMQSLGKIPWHHSSKLDRSLPLLNTVA